MHRWIGCFALLASTASADVMTPDSERRLEAPTDCPPGSAGLHGSHGDLGRPPYCAPTHCTGDSDCANGTGPCREVALCVQQVPTGEQSPTGERVTYAVARGACGANGACDLGTCETAPRCAGVAAEPGAPASSATPVSRGCACRASHAPAASGCAAFLLALGARRRRGSRGSRAKSQRSLFLRA